MTRAKSVAMWTHQIHVELEDGRKLDVPIAWYPVIADADEDKQLKCKLIGHGTAVYWPDIDEYMSIDKMLMP